MSNPPARAGSKREERGSEWSCNQEPQSRMQMEMSKEQRFISITKGENE